MKRARFAAVLIAVGVLVSACGGDEPSASNSPTPTIGGTTSPTSSPSRTGRTVDVIDNAYVPPELTVTVGTEVIWTQTGTATHTITASDGSFDSHPGCPNDISACMKPGDSFRFTFTRAGSFTYACKVHGELMSGTIVVQ